MSARARLATALAHQAHIWLAVPPETTDAATRERALAILDDEERARYQAFHFERDRLLFLAAHVLVRSVLSRYVAVRPEAWRFVTNPHGRPEIATPIERPLRFNLSHTHGLAACVVTLDVDAGIDVERRRRVDDLRGLASYAFAPDEREALHALPADAHEDRFFTYWTLKEAYIKARGLGLALDLQRFAFALPDPGGTNRIEIRIDPSLGDVADGWRFVVDRPTPDHQLAVALRARGGSWSEVVTHAPPLAMSALLDGSGSSG